MRNRPVLISISFLAVLFIFFGILGAESGGGQPAAKTLPVATPASVAPDAVVAPQAAPPTPAPAAAPNPINIVAPAENAHLPALASTFVCGSVPAGAQLRINGVSVPVHPGGGFVTMVPLTPGVFSIQADWQQGDTTAHLSRTIYVAAPEKPAPASPLQIVAVSPRQDQEVLPGDWIVVSCKGSPGMKGYFTVSGVRRRLPLTAVEPESAGLYQGVYLVGEHDRLHQSRIKVTLVDRNSGQRTALKAEGVLSLFPKAVPVMAETISPDVVLRAGPGLSPDDKAGYLMFPPPGTVLRLSGRVGSEYRVRLTPTRTAWVGVDQVKRLAAGTPPAYVMVGSIAVRAGGLSTQIRIPLGRRIPYLVNPDITGQYLDLSLFGAFSNTDLIANPSGGVIQNIRWFQDDQETYRLRVETVPGGWWGYDARYEGNTLVLELRTPPPLPAAGGGSPLAGLTIALDAGHGKGGGAGGVTGYPEGDANLALTLNLQQKLLALGARVILTRPGDTDVPLGERTRFAWQHQADLLISLHNNSLGYGGNPLLKHGFGVYYFAPQSRLLAVAVHDAYRAAFATGAGAYHLPDDGLYYDNLALTRPPQMPSILIETAYMIVPEEEAYLKTEDFRSVCSDAIIHGLESYVRAMRPDPAAVPAR